MSPHIRKIRPPRGLVCDFPLGRPLGKAQDPDFQHRVLAALFEMLRETAGPVLREFDEIIDASNAEPLVCSLPPRLDESLHPAIDETRAIRQAYDRAIARNGNRIGAGREVSADEIPGAVEAFVRIAAGTPWKEAGIPGNPMRVAQDIRGYYQTAAIELARHTPDAWAGENWFYADTETGRLMLEARRALKAADAPRPLWFFLSPGDRPA